MHLHFEPVQWIVRGYTTGTYENGDAFDMVLSMFKAGRTRLYVYAAHGKMPADIRSRLIAFAKEQKVEEIVFTHKNKTSIVLTKE